MSTRKAILSALCATTLLAGPVAADTVRIAYPNWAEGIAMTNLIAVILEDEMGYDVELTQADPGVIYAAVANGDQDVFLDAWLPSTHADYWAEFGDRLENLGTTFGYGISGLVVPAYVGIDSIEELNGIADELDGKIIGIGTGAGITKMTTEAIAEYDLDLTLVNSSGPAMTAALADAIEEERPIVVTGWKPHWKFGRFDLKVLDDPRGVFPIDGIRKVARPGFSEALPEVRDLLVNFSMTEEQLLDLMIRIDDSDDEPIAVAADWARDNEPLIQSWLPR